MFNTRVKLENLELLRDLTHTKIYTGVLEGEKVYLKFLKNYNKKVNNQDVVKSKNNLENIGLKCFSIIESGVIDGEKYYISKEVKGKDFEELLRVGKTFEELEDLIEESMYQFIRMLKNDYYYFGYNLKNLILSEGELILIDIEEVKKVSFFKKKPLIKTMWNSLRSLEAGSRRCNISYKKLESMLFDKYEEILGDKRKLKKDIERYKSFRKNRKKLKSFQL